MIHVLMLVGALVLGAVNTWQRLGRSAGARRWARTGHRDFGQRNVLVLWPALAVALLGGAGLGLSQRVDAVPAWPFVVLTAAGLVTWLAYAVLPLPVPGFVQPRWYRDGATRG